MAKMLPEEHLDTDVYTLALERTARVFDDFDHVYVAFSGGKDSTAVLQVALEVLHSDPVRWARHFPLRAVFFDEEALAMETEEYVRRVSQRDDVVLDWLCLPVQHRNACSRKAPFWWPWAPEDEEKWCRPLPPEAITELRGFDIWPREKRLTIPYANGLLSPPERGNTAMLMGIRADESLSRRRLLRQKGQREHHWIVQYKEGPTAYGNLWKAYPVYDWSTQDVWTAPRLKGWDYNRAYDRMEMMGIPHSKQRCSPAFGEQPIRGLHMFAQCFPEVWAGMAERVPGVGAAVRYANTELYGHRGRPVKPEDMNWPDFLMHYLMKFEPNARRIIAERVRDFFRQHYRKTTTPIAPLSPHPVSGVSWKFLLKIAMDGDFKERRNPSFPMTPWQVEQNPAGYAQVWKGYCDELAEVIERGEFHDLAFPGPQLANVYDWIPAEYRAYLDV